MQPGDDFNPAALAAAMGTQQSPPQPPQLDAKSEKARQAMLKLLSTPPENIISMLDRLNIPWDKINNDGESVMVIRWSDLMTGEKENQAQGPFIRKVMEEMRGEFSSDSPMQ